MERNNGSTKAVKATLCAGVLYLALAEIMHFISIGGLDNPLGRSLIKIIGYITLFLVMYFDKTNEMLQMFDILQQLLLEVRRMRKEE
jgi:hypothetical protein